MFEEIEQQIRRTTAKEKEQEMKDSEKRRIYWNRSRDERTLDRDGNRGYDVNPTER